MRRDTHLPNGRATLGGLVHDAAAGANLALTMLPKAMAYAVVAGVPPVYGLYASCAADPDVQISRFRFFMGEPRSWWCTDGQFEALAEGSA